MENSNYQRGVFYKGNLVKIKEGKKVIYKEDIFLEYKDNSFSDLVETILPFLSMIEYDGKGDTENADREYEKIMKVTYPILTDGMVGEEGTIYADASTIREMPSNEKKNSGKKKRG